MSFYGTNPDNNNGNEHCLELVNTKMNDARCEVRKKVSCRFFGPTAIDFGDVDDYVVSFYDVTEEVYGRKGMKIRFKIELFFAIFSSF